ncbi:hypothetical protein AKUA1202_01280 [Apilactobacillus kunkeei]|uniref:Gram-positive cocci surface proteins LPxTG domain-containing protein n=2 Tax=Lactobacillales TaxID=186826 RepID=A0AAC8WB85_9LACO|nr:DUF1542 domain-containing protein [Apilactobacillus kunkeei]ALJ31099.1 hypothetical protein APS55_02140 [Apilactobacillus kunkeei]KFJ15630.1 hypothetical protein JI66_01205 [Apilactobacillus kunkeei]CAI2617177.1 hypothetical protein AKUA1202_01280 [Apilactobacillus kunkeei]
MLYNHKQFRKNSDKKIMRKVKKNWVVLSVASFALIGSAAVIQSNQNVAFASETQVSANSTTNKNNNDNNISTIESQKNDAKAQLDTEASKVKDDISNDVSLSQSDKDSQKAEVDSYKVAGEQSIDSAKDANSINQALIDGKNNIDASHVAGHNSTDSNESSNASSSANQSSNDIKSQPSSTSSVASLASSASSSSHAKEGLSLRDSGSSAPADSNTFITGPGGANGTQYKNAIANTKLTYNGVNYDPSTNKYMINFQFGSEVISSTGGADRVLEFALNLSPNLSSRVSKVTVTNDDGTKNLTMNNGRYYIKYKTGKVVGGNIDLAVYVDPIKATPGDWISAFMSTHRENSRGELINFSTQIAFSSTRSLTYDQFGNDFNFKLLAQLQGKVLNDLNQTSPLSQTTQLKNNYVSQINAVTTSDDFVNVLNSIKNAYKADNSSLSNAISQLNSQSATSTNNVSNLGNLPANDKQTANNWIKSALQTAQSNVMGVSQSSDIAGALSDGINSIKKIELQATINSAINDINNAVVNTTNKINSDITLSKEKSDRQLRLVSVDKTYYTGLIQSSNDLSKISGVRDNAVNQINGDYTPGTPLSTQKQTAKDSLDNEANKIKAAIDADNTLTNDEKNRQKSNVDSIKAAAQSQIDSATNADGINDAQSQGIASIDNAHQTSSTSLSDQKSNAKSQLDAEADKVKQQIDADNTLTSAEKNSQKANVDSVKATDQGKIDAATNADDVITAYQQGIKDIDAQYVAGKTSVADQQANAKAQLDAEATKVKQQIDADNSLTSAEKATQKANVDSVKAIDQGKIDTSTNADDINAAYQQGIQDIDGQYTTAKTSLPDQKSNAKSQLDAEATKVKQQIEADNSLTSVEKATQKANVDSVKSTYQGKIDAATNADDINTAYQQGIKDIDAQYVAGKTSVADQQSNAKAQLDAEATKVKKQIESDNTLTSAEKAKQKANVDSTKSIDQTAIDTATNADDINTAYHKGIQDIDNQYIPGKTSLADQKTNAKADLDAQAAKIKNDIANDATLTQDQKNDQMDQLAADKVAAEQAIDNAADADGINKALGDGNLNMEADHQPGQAIDNQKASAKQAIQAEANKVKAAIAADFSLTSEEKAKQKNAVDSASAAAQSNIDHLTNADDINSAIKQGIYDVDGKHVAGTSLDTQKANAKSLLNDEANNIKQAIANDATLTNDQKNIQMARVDSDKAAAESDIDNAADADGVNKAINNGKNNIDSDHQPGQSVDTQKANAKSQLDAQAAKIKSDIENDATLTNDEKNAQIAKVDSDTSAGKQAIDNASDADGINKATKDSNDQIASDHKAGTSVNSQKDSNNANLDAEATKVKNQIDADVSLTSAEKAEQKNNVENVKSAAHSKIDSAVNADDIKSAYDQGIKDIDAQYVPGKTSLADQKANAKSQLDVKAAKVKQDIANDATLTQIQKNEQIAMVDADKESAETSIDVAKDADAVNKAISDGNKNIDSDHQPGKSLADQKADAKAAIQAEASKIKSEIDADSTLTSAEKAAQKDKVDSVSAADQNKIDGLTNVDDIHAQITQSVIDIDIQHQSGKDLNDQKQAAKAQLDATADKIKQDIENDVTLTQADKDAQKAKVDSDTSAGKQTIDNAENADSINQAIQENNDKIASDHVSHQSVDDQKTNAKKQLDAQAAKVKQDISNDTTLTKAQKDAQMAQVDSDRESAEKAIDSANDAEGIKESIDSGNDKINKDHVQGDSVDTQKANAKKQLDNQAAKVKNDIANDNTLTQAEKDAQMAKVDADKTSGEKAIDSAENADDINKLISDTSDKINGDHVPGQSVNDQKTAKKAELDAEANKIKSAIDADNTLTQAQKDAQKANVDADVADGKKAIDNASDAESIKQVIDSTNAKIDGEHQPGKSVDDQKANAKSILDSEANKVKAAIDADNTLTSAEKQQQKNNVDQVNQAAKDKIDAASSADEINDLVSRNSQSIDAQHQPGKPVSDQKTAAKNQLDTEAKKIKDAIDADQTLSQSEKDAQKSAVDADVVSGKQAIDNSSDSDSINKAIGDTNDKIDGEHVSGKPLSDQKTNAKSQLDAYAESIKNAIDNDATLTQSEKDAQKDKVDDDVKAGKQAIDNSNDADSINKLVSDTNDKVKNEHQPGTSVADQKTNAKKQLDDQADKVKNDIQNDPTLTQTEKNNQLAKVDSDVTAGKQAIDNSSDADSINKAISDSNDKVSADHVSGTSLDNQKTAANAKLDAEANKTKAAIDADNTLTSAEKTTQKAKVDSDVATGKQNIEKATDADSINKLVNDTNEQVDAEHVPGQSLDAQKQAAKKAAEDKAKQTKAAIDADNTLTSAEKAAQKNKVDSENATAQEKIGAATNADDINSLSDRMIGDIAQSYVPGTSLDAQKQAAKDKLSQHVQDLINQIFGDDTLTQAEKDAQKDKVDNDKAAAEKSIDAASDADNINQALSDARPKLDADYIPGASLSDQKNAAKTKLDETAAKTKNAISNDVTLTQTEKNNQMAKVDSDVTAGKQAIDNAKNSDSINKVVDDTSAQVNDDHKSADSIDTQKANAKNQLTAKADKIKQDIENDATLTQAEKESQKNKVEDDVKSGNQAIDNASDADSINKAGSDSDYQVSSEHKPADSLDVQKENAKSAIDEAAKNTKAAIDADNTLTSDEKESQKAKVDENATASKQVIDNAQNADNINSSVSLGKTDVSDVHKSADSIDTQKNAAKSQLDANTAKIKQDIANDDTLTQSEKDAQTKQVDADKATAEQAIDNASDADGINQALKDGNTKTSGDHKPGNSTNDQKAAAKKKLDAEAEKIKNAIDNDVTLNRTEKAQQKQNVDSQNQAAKDKIDASTNADDINSASDQGVSNIDEQHKSSDVSLSQQKENAKSQLDAQAAKVKNDIANDATLTQTEKDAQMAQVDADKAAVEQDIDNAPDADSINQAISNGNAKIDADHVSGQSVDDQKTSAKDAINNEANKVKAAIDADKTLSKTEKQRQRNNVERARADAQAAIDGLTNADDINAAVADYIQIIDSQHVKKQNNGSGPEQTIPRNIYMVKNFYRYLSTNFTKKNRVQGYKATSRPNAAMFRIIGETTNKNGVKRYKVYQIVVKKNGLFKVDRKKWGYITARPSYMRPLYYSSNVQQIKVIGRGIREYKNVKFSKAIKGYKHGTVLKVKAVKKYGSTYRLQLTNGQYITANKNLVRKQTTPRNIYMVKGFYRYSSVNFSHKNRIHGYKKQARPNAVMFRIVGETTNKNGLKRYKVYQIVRNKKGLLRVDHKKWGYVTAKSSYVEPLYYSNAVNEVRVISDRIRVYKNLKLTKSVKSYKRGTVLKVKTVKKIGSTYRFQLTNGNYISANKNLVQKIK